MKTAEIIANAYSNYLEKKKILVPTGKIIEQKVNLFDQSYEKTVSFVLKLFDIKLYVDDGEYYIVSTQRNSKLALELIEYITNQLEMILKEEIQYVHALDDTERLAQFGIEKMSRSYVKNLVTRRMLDTLRKDCEQIALTITGDEGYEFLGFALPIDIESYRRKYEQ